jgi:hypothetical protein
MTDTSTALERVEAHDLAERKRLSRMLLAVDVMSQGSLLKADLRKDNNARTVAITLDQLGVPATINNMNACFVINGAVGMMTWLWCAVASAHGGHEVWLDEASNAEAGIAHLRRGDTGTVRTVTFTIKDAQRAGLTTGANKHNYEKYTTDMLGWRALSRVVKRYAPEVMAGLAAAGAVPEPVLAGAHREQFLVVEDPADDDVVDGEIVGQGEDPGLTPPPPSTVSVPVDPPLNPPELGDEQDEVYANRRRRANAVMGEVGVKADDARHQLVHTATGGATESTGRLTAWQVEAIVAFCDRLKADDQVPEGAGDNGDAQVVGASTAPPPPGPVPGEWRARAVEQGVSDTRLLILAREVAGDLGVDLPPALDRVTDEVAAGVLERLG